MVCECVEKIGKNPIAIRVVTNVVLMISDADVVFSFLFMANLFQAGEEDALFLFFFFVVLVGMLTYALGTLYLAPKQKTVTAKLVLKFLMDNPTECVSKKWYRHGPGQYREVELGNMVPVGREVTISKDLPVYPTSSPGRPNPLISKLNLATSQDDRDTLKSGLGQWGLGALWDSIEQKNAWNCAEIKHGVPFFRLARFGFMSQPTPKDLGSILNMNALYSFTTGIVQLIFGGILLATAMQDASQGPSRSLSDSVLTNATLGPSVGPSLESNGPSLESYGPETGMSVSGLMMLSIPLGISFFSLVLSIFNVVFDFAGLLSETECEKRMMDAIMQKSDVDLASRKQTLEKDHKKAVREVEAEYKRRDQENPADTAKHALDKETEIEGLTQRYAMDLSALDSRTLTILEIELNGYRNKKARIKQILMGKAVDVESKSQVDALRNAMEIKEVHQKIENKITQCYKEQLEALEADLDNLTPQEFTARQRSLTADYHFRLQTAREARDNDGNGLAGPVGSDLGDVPASVGSIDLEVGNS